MNMSVQATLQLPGVKYTVENPSATKGKLLDTVKLHLDSAAGAFDWMNALKKLSVLIGYQHGAKQFGGYLSGTALPRVYTAGHALHNTVKSIRADKIMTPQRGFELAHQISDFFQMCTYSFAFFRKNPTTSLHAATCLGVACDGTDVLTYSTQVYKGWDRKSQLASASTELQRANQNSLHNALIKLAKAVTAFAASIFAVFVLMGTALVSPTIAVTVALASSVFNIAAYYHKNYVCDTFLKVDLLSAKQA